jgi:hypothetical protein
MKSLETKEEVKTICVFQHGKKMNHDTNEENDICYMDEMMMIINTLKTNEEVKAT